MNNIGQVEEILKDNLVKRTRSGQNPEKTLIRQFKQIDLDHNGKISLAEFRKAVEPYVLGTPDELISGLFDKWDADKSGSLEVREFVDGLFKTEEERAALTEKRKKEKSDRQSKSIRADDIIEQAKARRAAREARVEEDRKRTVNPRQKQQQQPNVQARLASYTKKKPNILEHQEQRMINGPFRRDTVLDQVPDMLRYRVSSTWVSVNPPSNWDAKKELRKSAQQPSDSLELEFVYGSNPKCGMYTTDTGEVVYAAAGLGVVYNPRKHEQRFFKGHDDDVTCISLDPSQRFVATGCMGKSPIVHVWDIKTMQSIGTTQPGFYDRRITAVGFINKSPKFLVAIGGDNHHMMAIWDWANGRMISEIAAQNGIPPQINCIVFDDTGSRKSTVHRFVTCGFKHTKFWKFDEASGTVTGGKNATYGRVSPTPRETRSAVFLNEDTALTGGSNGVIYVWDLTKNTCKRAVPAHDGPVLGMLVAADEQLITSGAKDRVLNYWSTANTTKGNSGLEKLDSVPLPENDGPAYSLGFIIRGKATPVLVMTTMKGALLAFCPNDKPEWKTLIGGHCGDLYGLAVHPTHPGAFCTVGEDRILNVWDAESRQVINTVQLPGQGRSVDISTSGRHASEHYVAIGCKDGSFCVLETTSFTLLTKAKHCEETIDDLKFSPDSSMLAVASHDNYIDIYQIDNGTFSHTARCKGHSSYITHIDWSADSQYIMSNCGAYERLVWDANTGRVVSKTEYTRDIDWSTITCTLGFDVMGIWPESADGTDVNALSRSPEHDLLVTGDDSGNVNLFNFPCLVKAAPHRTFNGHSSHVMNVRWLSDGKKLVSVGGCDKSVFQWKRVSDDDVGRGNFQKRRPAPEGTTVGMKDILEPKQTWKPATQWK